MKLRSHCLLACLFVDVAGASLDPSYRADFTYSQHFELDLSSEAQEQTSEEIFSILQQQQHQREDDSGDEEIASALEQLFATDSVAEGEMLYDESCIVLAQNIMEPPEYDLTAGEGWFHASSVFPRDAAESFLEDLDSDDEDDDNDGHSSMLSNASLRARLSDGVDQQTHYYPQAATSVALLSFRGGASFKEIARSSLSSEISKTLVVTALVTLVFEAMIGHILEFLKIVMQTSDTTYANVIQQITAEKGIAGLWDGFCPWGIVQAVFKGAVFGLAHASAAGVLVPMAEQGKIPMQLALTLAGGIGGGFQGYVLSPTLLLKTRVMTNPVFREKMSILRTTLLSLRIGYDVVKTEGLLTLMKGSNVFATKRVFDWASRYFFADLFEALFLAWKGGQPLSVAEKSAASLLGGVASTCVTLPLDVLVAKTQDAKKAGVKVSALQLFQEELQEKGLRGLKDAYMRGFEARLVHVCLTTVVIKTGTPIAYEAIFGPKQ